MPLIEIITFLCKNAFFIIAGLIGINFIIGFHELGHFLFAKLFNVGTPSFSIGFGPKLIKRTIGDTEFALSAIPIGGYVEIEGMAEVGQGDQKGSQSQGDRSFSSKPWWQKNFIMLGGILFNLIFAYFALTLIFMIGAPSSPMMYPFNATNTIETVEPNSPGAQAGLAAGDTIKKINGHPAGTGNLTDHLKHLRDMPNTTAPMEVERLDKNGTPQTLTLDVPLSEVQVMGKACGYHGIIFKMHALPSKGILDSLYYGVKVTNTMIYRTFCAITNMFTSRDFSQVGSPLMVISATIKGAGQGFKIFLLLLALISINLAILNLIPVPILDGGQWLFYTIEALIGRQLPLKIKEYIHIASWVAFMLLIVYLGAFEIKGFICSYWEKARAFLGW